MNTETALDPFNIDVRLISAVQAHAGARCHEAANRLAAYTLWAEVNHRAVADRDRDEAEFSRHELERTEVDLRKFLFECRRPACRSALPVIAAATASTAAFAAAHLLS
jgi:hypothetical protein